LSIARIPVDLLVFGVVVQFGMDLLFHIGERSFLALLARVQLLSADVFHADFPKGDVAGEENGVEDAAYNWADDVACHQQPVEQAVGKHGQKQACDEICAAFLGLELGQGEEIAHYHAEEEMCRNREQGPDDARPDAATEGFGSCAENVHDILHTGETQADERGIDDAIHVFVEVFVAPN